MKIAGNYLIIGRHNLAPLSSDFTDYQDGVLLVLDKPYQWTSADAVRKLKFRLQRHFGMKNIKVGHAGTLDPLATGILLICIGKATKYAEAIQAEKKEYIAEITFGATTPSFDLEKDVDALYPFEHITPERINDILPTFLGEQEQLPPIYSAKFVGGMRAYERARLGEDVELKRAKINIYALEVLDFSLPTMKIRIECSKGTYIRALARDLGLALESGAYLSSLVRTASGGYKIEDAFTLEESELLFQKS